MIQCLGSEAPASLSEFPELMLSEPEERIGDSIPALLDPDVCSRVAAPDNL